MRHAHHHESQASHMIQALKGLFGLGRRASTTAGAIIAREAPEFVAVDGSRLDFRDPIDMEDGLPHVDWEAVRAWCDGFDDDERGGMAWLACEHAWLLHLRDALGSGYRLFESNVALLLTRQNDRAADLTLAFVARTGRRVQRLLGRLAHVEPWGRDILILFDDADTYYRYVGAFHPEDEDFAASSGMFISAGCAHFVSVDQDLHAVEPVIVHEMSHAMVTHLPLPTWLNEGIAVNAEHRLAGDGATVWDRRELVRRHRAFWTPPLIQGFWSGQSYLRPDEGNELSYDLGRIIVDAMSSDWTRFEDFALAAQRSDGGKAAAREVLGVDLGAFVASFLGAGDADAWRPRPECWTQPPEKGGF
ncbi:MAG TPA: hypothetical protein PKZ76_06820 [Xanthomonadaceae bacterium]|nr:hypothetical protein [Xanthomonadaceae bacterium]